MYNTWRFVKFDRPSNDWIWLYEHQSSSRLSPRSSSLSNFLMTFRPTLKIFKLGRDRATPNLSTVLVDSWRVARRQIVQTSIHLRDGGTCGTHDLGSAATPPVLASKFLMAAPQVVILGYCGRLLPWGFVVLRPRRGRLSGAWRWL